MNFFSITVVSPHKSISQLFSNFSNRSGNLSLLKILQIFFQRKSFNISPEDFYFLAAHVVGQIKYCNRKKFRPPKTIFFGHYLTPRFRKSWFLEGSRVSVGLSVCRSVGLSVCIHGYLGNQWSDLAEILVGDKVRKYPQAVFSFYGKVDFKGLPTSKNMPKMAKIV